MSTETQRDPRVTAWANGFGQWHVRVPRNAAGPLLAARRALRDELTQRERHVTREVWVYAVEVPDLSDADTIVYREWLRDHDPVPAWAQPADLDAANESARRVIATWTRGLITLAEMVTELQKIADAQHADAVQAGVEIAAARQAIES